MGIHGICQAIIICGKSILICLITIFCHLPTHLQWFNYLKATIICNKLKETMEKLHLKNQHKLPLEASQMIPAHRLSDLPDIKQL